MKKNDIKRAAKLCAALAASMFTQGATGVSNDYDFMTEDEFEYFRNYIEDKLPFFISKDFGATHVRTVKECFEFIENSKGE